MNNHNQYKQQFIQTIKNQYNKIKSLENELTQCNANVINAEKNAQNLIFKVKELEENVFTCKNQLELKSNQLECANEKINEMANELAVKSNQLECANEKINVMTADLDKRNDAIYQIDKIILRNNDYFDEVKKELNDKITCGKEMTEMYQKTNDELFIVRNEMELLQKELDEKKKELQLYKNDFILRSATF